MTNYVTAAGVQPFVIQFGNSTTASATINPVGSGAFIIYGGTDISVGTSPAQFFSRLTLANSTTVTATRNTANASEEPAVYGCVVDGDTTNLIKSVQFKTISIASASASGTTAITAVTNANTAVHLLGWSSTNTTYSGINENPVVTLSGTTLTATRVGTTGALTVGCVVIEFQSSCLNQSVQNIAATSSASVTSYTASVTSLNVNNTMTFFAGHSCAAETTNISTLLQRGQLTSSTQFTVNVNTASANAKKYNCSLVEFKSGVLHSSVQRGSISFTSTSGASTNLGTAVNYLYAGSSRLGETTAFTAITSGNLVAVLAAYYLTYSISGGPSISELQQLSQTSSTTLPFAITLGAAPTAGNLIAVAIGIEGAGTVAISSVTDDAGQTYTHLSAADASNSAGSKSQTKIYYFQNTLATPTTITIAGSGTFTQMNATVYQISGVPTSGPAVDATGVLNNGASSLLPAIATVTTTAAYDIIIAVGQCSSTTMQAVTNFAFYNFDNWISMYAVLPNIGISPVNQYFTQSGSADTYCSSAAAFLANTTGTVTSIINTVPEANSGGTNVTTSYEVFEFTPPIPSVSLLGKSAVMSAARGAATGRVPFLGQSSIQLKGPGTLTVAIGGIALQSLSAIQMKSFGGMQGILPLQARSQIQVKLSGRFIPFFFLSAMGSIKTSMRGTLTNFNFLFGRSAVQVKLVSAPTFKASLKSLATAMIKARGGVSTFLSLAIGGLSAIQVKGKSGITVNASMQARNAIQIKGLGNGISASFMHAIGKIALKLQASIGGSAAVSGKMPVMVKSTLTITGKVPMSGNVLTLVQGRAQPSGSVNLSGRSPTQVKSRGIYIFAKFLNSIANISVRMRGIMRTKAGAPIVCCRPIEEGISTVSPNEAINQVSAFYETPSTVNTDPIEDGNNSCGC